MYNLFLALPQSLSSPKLWYWCSYISHREIFQTVKYFRLVRMAYLEQVQLAFDKSRLLGWETVGASSSYSYARPYNDTHILSYRFRVAQNISFPPPPSAFRMTGYKFRPICFSVKIPLDNLRIQSIPPPFCFIVLNWYVERKIQTAFLMSQFVVAALIHVRVCWRDCYINW